jgi:cell division septation protein DedD
VSGSEDVSNPEAALAAPAADDLLALGNVSAGTGDTRLPSTDVYQERPSALAPEPVGDPVPTRVEPVAPATPGTAAKAPTPVATTSAPSPRGRFEVQVMSLKGRNEAEAVVRSLNGKGYAAFVTESFEGGHWYRVRVGGFANRGEADAAVARLEKEQKYQGLWVAPSP